MISPLSPDGPIFVVGTMRSGSTLLRLVLDSHERIAIGAETGFMGALTATKQIPNWRYGREWHTRLGWTDDELDERLREFYAGMFSRYAAQRGKARWGDKTPFHTAHIELMARVFPDASFIGIVRHPGAVANSLTRKFHYRFTDAVQYWLETNLEMVRGATQIGDRFTLCRYEDLVTATEPVTRELMAWLGEPWSPQLLEHEKVQREQGAPRVVDGNTSSRDPIDPDRANDWAGAVSADEMQVLRETAGPLAAWFGYDVTDARVLEPLVAKGEGRQTLLSGSDLQIRRNERPGGVDFDLRPTVPDPDASLTDLAARVARAEAALERVRARRAIIVSDSLRRALRGRSLTEFRNAVTALRGTPNGA